MNDEAARQDRHATSHNSSAADPTNGRGAREAPALRLELPGAIVEQLIDEVTARVRAELPESSPWMTRGAAAKYLSVPASRLEKDRTVPCRRWNGRVLYRRDELDAWLGAQ